MNKLLMPAVKLMQRLALLHKFALVTLIFVAPLLLVGALLFNELHKSIASAEQERAGLRYLRDIGGLIQLTQQQRALQHLVLTGNAKLLDAATQQQQQLRQQFDRFSTAQNAGASFGTTGAWCALNQHWQALQAQLPTLKAKQSFAEHSALIAQMNKLAALVTDRSQLRRDPEVDAYYLGVLIAQTLPEITEGLSEIAGRGAAYIDTGLFEANEDVMLNSAVMLAHHQLDQIPARLEPAFNANPVLKTALTPSLTAIAEASQFLERAKNEVLNSFNQTSGEQFFGAGRHSVDGLYALSSRSAALLDELLQQRIAQQTLRRNLIMAGALLALGIAAYLLAGFYLSFRRDVGHLETAVARAAAGDLGSRVRSDAHDEIGRLVNAFGDMTAGLATLVHEVRAGSDTIGLASQEIAGGNADLSARTEAQAGALEETASSMEELTATVRQNAENAQRASRLALSASDVARQGGHAVARVVDTMGAIRDGSRRIADIISVIDGIAFQTNILALNAAVEAARAGEQGRGFAVVAAEVRSLAQRSAAAAKEIKALIGNSVDQVDAGQQLVDAAGHTMQEIVDSIQRVAHLIGDISNASREQSAGIEQVNQAIVQMDEMTQQNAALVEQAAAAAESMQEQAQVLAQAVSVFTLDDQAQTGGNWQADFHQFKVIALTARASGSALQGSDHDELTVEEVIAAATATTARRKCG